MPLSKYQYIWSNTVSRLHRLEAQIMLQLASSHGTAFKKKKKKKKKRLLNPPIYIGRPHVLEAIIAVHP